MPAKKSRLPKQNPTFRGDRLVKIRELMDLSQDEMDKLLGFSPGTTGRYERGEHEPGTEQLAKIVKGTHASSDWFLGIVDDPEGYMRPPDKNQLKSEEQLMIHKYRTGRFMELIHDLSADALAKRTETGSDTEDDKSK